MNNQRTMKLFNKKKQFYVFCLDQMNVQFFHNWLGKWDFNALPWTPTWDQSNPIRIRNKNFPKKYVLQPRAEIKAEKTLIRKSRGSNREVGQTPIRN